MIKNFKRKRVYARFKDNIWVADVAEIGWLSSKNQGVKYSLCVIDVFTKYVWIKPLKDEKTKTVLHDFVERVNLNTSQINYGLIKEKKIIIHFTKMVRW